MAVTAPLRAGILTGYFVGMGAGIAFVVVAWFAVRAGWNVAAVIAAGYAGWVATLVVVLGIRWWLGIA